MKSAIFSLTVHLVTVFCLFFCSGQVHAVRSNNEVVFRTLSTVDGLSSNIVYSMYRDTKGFLWVGTAFGLNRYDAYHVTQYLSSAYESLGSMIGEIFEDYRGNIWIHDDKNGYTYYNYRTNMIHHDVQEILFEYGILVDNIVKIGSYEHYLWVYADNRIYVYDFEGKTVAVFKMPESRISDIYMSGDIIYYIEYNSARLHFINLKTSVIEEVPFPDRYRLLLATFFPKIFIDKSSGIWLYSGNNSTLLYKAGNHTDWKEIELPVTLDSFNHITDIAEDSSESIWITTTHHGAFVYDKYNDSFAHFCYEANKPHTLLGDNLYTIHIDYDDIVWIGTNKLGVSYYVPQVQTFLSYSIGKYNDVLSFCDDEEGIYLGTDGSGLMFYSNIDKSIRNIDIDANVIESCFRDSKGRLWIGTFRSGLFCYDKGKITHYNTANSDLMFDDVFSIKEDEDGNIWLAIYEGYIQKLDVETNQITTIYGELGEQIRDLVCFDKHQLFAATNNGLLSVNTQTGEYHYVDTDDIGITLHKSYLYSLFKDHEGILWMGTSDGLLFYNLQTDSIGRVDIDFEASANIVTAVTEDLNGQIWIGTSNGLFCINRSHTPYMIHQYKTSEGLAFNSINQRALYCTQDGKIYVGTPKGYTVITPKKKVQKDYDAPIFLTYATIGKDAKGNAIECKNSIYSDEFVLQQHELPINLHFSTLDFDVSQKVTYVWSLDEDKLGWQKMDGNSISFPILSPGTYELMVKAYNSEGALSADMKSIRIKVLPPWYYSGLAWFVYSLIAAGIIYGIGRYVRKKRKRVLYIKKIEQEAEEQKRMADMKMNFFANISHELRTPLSLIINPLEEFMKRYPQYSKTLLSTVHGNAKYLLELIEQLLSFRKLDAEGETMNYSHLNIVQTAKDLYFVYRNVAEKRNIQYKFFAEPSVIKMDCDNAKMIKIIHNLLSNAFKFTPDGGIISLNIRKQDDNQLLLQVSDTGIGIPVEEYDKVFDMFYQAKNNDWSQGGSGIGLYLVSQYVRMHYGEINVKPNMPQGTVFSITIPINNNISISVSEKNLNANKEPDIYVKQASLPPYAYTLLAVDDNVEFLDFLCESLSPYYKVLRAMDANTALDLVSKEEVDLVISDVMMSDMDGLELCRRLKTDLKTSHIPIILLTAKAGEEFQLEGFEAGADEYIVKPFHMEILKMRIDKFIGSGINKKQVFEEQVNVEPSRISITPLDRQFVEKAIKVVEDNLRNENLSVEELALHMNISRGHLYRKLLKLTGKNAFEFIRIIRMKRAQQLLAESQMLVAEVAYELGYNSPKTFSKHFKQEFGITPSAYVQSLKK